jgi:1-acyl-sn-glycerol-3-phosphate acyltransferase
VRRFIFLVIRRLAALIMPVFHTEGLENLPDGPFIAVGNHSKTYGPVASELYFPGKHYTWCISEMMERDRVADYAYKDFWSKKPAIVRPFFRLFSYMIPTLCEIVFTNALTIPVYRDKRIMKTFQISVDRLKENAAVVIFPEEYTEYNNIVHHFQRGFVHVAKYYYRQTGKPVPFVPVYVCPQLKKMVFGKPIMYDPGAKSAEEAERICTYLQDAISEIAFNLPRHRVVPYPNVSKKYYPYNER